MFPFNFLYSCIVLLLGLRNTINTAFKSEDMDVLVERSEVEGSASPPPSKSYTHRAFFAASLSKRCRILNPLYSGDTLSTLKACEFLGARVEKGSKDVKFVGVDDIDCSGYINVENSGTTLRILMGLLAQSNHKSVADGDRSLRKRPNKALALALKKLGAEVESKNPDYTAPVSVRGKISGGDVEIKAESSQFVSSLLFTLPLCYEDSTLSVIELKSRPYIDITVHVLNKAGIKLDMENKKIMRFTIPGGQNYKLREFRIPADFSSASYLIAAGLIAGRVRMEGVFDSMQGDRRIIEIAKEMGGKVTWDRDRGVVVSEFSELEGIEVDASDIPDLVPTIVVLGAVANGRTVIRNAEHLRIKEIDRIRGCCENLKTLGIDAVERRDGLIVRGASKIEGGVVKSFGDHRMALSFSLLGMVSRKGVVVKDAEVVSVSFPGYFDILREIGANIKFLG